MIEKARQSMAASAAPDLEVFEDNVLIVKVFERMGTQWRADSGALIGMDYRALENVMKWTGVAPDAEAEVFEGVRIMERETMRVIDEAKK